MASLKNTSDDCGPMPMSNYGYGLRIHLNDDQCEALGITKAVAAGSQVTLTGKAIVVASAQSVEDDGDDAGPDIELDLQITDLELQVGGVLKNAAEILYGG